MKILVKIISRNYGGQFKVKNYKYETKVSLIAIIGLLMWVSASSINAQNLTSSSWTNWTRIQQNGCIRRAKRSLNLAKITQTESNAWFVVGKAKNLNVRIKCIADDNTNNKVNPKTNRILIDVEVEGFTANIQKLNRLRNCIAQFVVNGKSTCWEIGTPKVRTIAWTATPRTLKLLGNNGQRFMFNCPPNGQIRPIWGSVSYTDNSSICTAATHNGSIVRNKGGNVVIAMDSGPRYFNSTSKNGIRSKEYQGEIRAFNFIKIGTGVTGNTNVLGRSWNENESGWKGVWTRRGNSNVFDAVWTKGRNVVKSTLTIKLNGNRVNVIRRNSVDGISCNYQGNLSGNKRNVNGTYTCWKNGKRFFTNGAWNAVINK